MSHPLSRHIKKTYLLSRSFKAKSYRTVWDKERKKYKRISMAWAAVKHLEFTDHQLFIIILRDKNNHVSPMYLLTSVDIQNCDTVWEMCFSYMHR